MRIACPQCTAEYEVPDRLLQGAARPLRCARCQHEWLVGGPAAPPAAAPQAAATPQAAPTPERFSPMPPPAAAPPAAEGDEPEAPRRPRPTRRPRQHNPIDPPLPRRAGEAEEDPQRRVALIAWAASITLLLVLAAAVVIWRQPIMLAWPPSGRLFLALGLL